MDAIYRVRPGGQHEELRYSLRALATGFPVERVWSVGTLPGWARGVEHVPHVGEGSKFHRITQALAEACQRVPAPFVLLDDDMFVLERTGTMPVLHRGPLSDMTRGDAYGRAGREALELLGDWGIDDPLSYELHVPLVIEPACMAEVLAQAAGRAPGYARTLYGNVAGIGGDLAPDVKVRKLRDAVDGRAFVSTSDHVFRRGVAGAEIRERFPEPSPWEEPPSTS